MTTASGESSCRLPRKDKGDAGIAELVFAGRSLRKHKCPNRLGKLMGLIDGNQVSP